MNKCFNLSFGKRLFDLVLTVPALILLSPLLIVLGFLVRLKRMRVLAREEFSRDELAKRLENVLQMVLLKK